MNQKNTNANAQNDTSLRFQSHMIAFAALASFFQKPDVTADRLVSLELDEENDQYKVGVLTGAVDVRTKQDLHIPYTGDGFVASLCQVGPNTTQIGQFQFVEVTPRIAALSDRKIADMVEALAAVRNVKTGKVANNIFTAIPRAKEGPQQLVQLAYSPKEKANIQLSGPKMAGIANVRDMADWKMLLGRQVDARGVSQQGLSYIHFNQVLADWKSVNNVNMWHTIPIDIPAEQTVAFVGRPKTTGNVAKINVTLYDANRGLYFDRTLKMSLQDMRIVEAHWLGAQRQTKGIQIGRVQGHDDIAAFMTPQIDGAQLSYQRTAAA